MPHLSFLIRIYSFVVELFSQFCKINFSVHYMTYIHILITTICIYVYVRCHPTHSSLQEHKLGQAGLEEVIERGNSEQPCHLMNLDWCWCGPHRCIIMPTAKECLCCWDKHYCMNFDDLPHASLFM